MDQAAPSQQPQVQPQYFPDKNTAPQTNPFLQKLKSWWSAFVYYARQVWPYVSRLINFLVYETIKTIKGIVKISLQQVGLFKD